MQDGSPGDPTTTDELAAGTVRTVDIDPKIHMFILEYMYRD